MLNSVYIERRVEEVSKRYGIDYFLMVGVATARKVGLCYVRIHNSIPP